ncbi:N-acetylneuraminate synthase family protein [Methylophilaceae bacterium]|nr:N-acetylneuraminate synthase family protein [Methylophilaceae bacterium]
MTNKHDLHINNKVINNNSPTYFIADIAANHDGDINKAIDLIYLSAESGANAAKFQHFNAKTIVSDYGFKHLDQNSTHQKSWKKSVYEVYEDFSVSLSWTEQLVDACKKANIDFFTTPYSLDIVDYVDDFVPAFKIGSGDITWLDLIEAVAKKKQTYADCHRSL